MNSILVVDDEAIIRQGIVSRIEYLKLLPDALYQASNGLEALEIVREHHPKIVMTDIRMPKMDGLELARQLRSQFPDIAVIILTVYGEFEYAKEALTLGVSDYLLKPISNSALVETLQTVDDKINENHQIENALSSAGKLKEEYEKLSSEQLFHKVLNSSSDSEKSNVAHKALFGTDSGDGHTYMLALAGCDLAGGEAVSKKTLLSTATPALPPNTSEKLSEIAASITSPISFYIFESYGISHQFYIVLCAQSAQILESNINFFLASLLFKVQEKLSLTLTLGVSEPAAYIGKRLAAQALEAYNQRLINGGGSFFLFNHSKDLKPSSRLQGELNHLTKSISEGNLKAVTESLQAIFEEAANLKFVWSQIINYIITGQSHRWGTLPPHVKNSLLYSLNGDVFDMFHSREEMISYLQNLIGSMFDNESIAELDSSGRMRLAIEYIDTNYTKDLQLNDTAERFAFSPNYFSTAFKKETGKNFVSYITALRMQEACRLLENTEVRVVDVSYKVGYDDSQYFFRVFKKHTGQTPLQYRNAINEGGLNSK